MVNKLYEKKIKEVFDLSTTKGDFGVEIEMETDRFFSGQTMSMLTETGWRIESDGSLRGPSAELVMMTPKSKKDTIDMVGKVLPALKVGDVNIKNSIRAGVHIHMNMQECKIQDFIRTILVYYPLETVLLNKCGEGRQGNLFCLRGRDAGYIFTALYKAIKQNDMYVVRSNDYRYASLNFQSLFTYGSLEFRALATTPTLENIPMWIEVLERIKSHALSIENSWDNMMRISGEGPKNYFTSVLGADLASNFYYDDMDMDILRDVRNVQHLCNFAGSKGL